MKDLKALALCIIFEGYVGTETLTRQRSYSCCSIHLRLMCTSLPLLLGYNHIINTCIKKDHEVLHICVWISDFLLYITSCSTLFPTVPMPLELLLAVWSNSD